MLFGTRAFLQAPLTPDLATVAKLLDESEVGLAGEATAIGDAVGLAVKHLDERPDGERVLVLLSDGESNAGVLDPKRAAELARDAGVRVYTIGVGTGHAVARRRGMRAAPGADETTLREIAATTGGRYFRADDTESLVGVYRDIDALEPTQGRSRHRAPGARTLPVPARRRVRARGSARSRRDRGAGRSAPREPRDRDPRAWRDLGLNLETFHFLRPMWLWSLLLLIPFGWSVLRRARSTGPWERVCDPHLLPHLVAQAQRGGARWPFLLLAISWSAAAVALAGPAWERLPQQTFREPNRTVFVLALGDTMNARDVRPSRLTRARHKLLDAVERVAGGSVALVVYREEAFAVTPLTDDAHVLREAIPLLDTRLMPGRRVLPGRGVEEAMRLLEPVGARGARIVLVSDGADDDPDATAAAVREAAGAGAHVSVLAVAGPRDALTALAQNGGGTVAPLAIDDGDLDQLFARGDAADPLSGASLTRSDIRADDWKDMGAWLLWIPLLLAPFAFRRGWAAAVVALLCLHFAPAPARAGELDLFQRPDQKGARAFAEGRFEESAQQFQDPAWQAAARYRAGDFAGAAEKLAPQTDPVSQYNLGNALAKAGKLEDAVAAYDRVLASVPGDEDARFNRDLVKKLLDQQPPQQSKGDQNDKSDSKQDQDSGQSKGDSSDSKQDASKQPQDSAKSQDSSASDGSQGQQGDPQQDAQAKDASKADGQDQPKPSDQADAKDTGAGKEQDQAPAAEKQPQNAGQDDAQQPDQAAAQDPRDAAGQQADAGEPVDPDAQAPQGDAQSLRSGPPTPEDQERAQWMARLPDDPGGLLREKIRRDYLRKQAERNGEGG